MNRHERISHFYHDYRRHTVESVVKALAFETPQGALEWLEVEFVSRDLDWHILKAGSPYPIGLPTVVRLLEEAIDFQLELRIAAMWPHLSIAERKTAERNFYRVFGRPELVQGSNSEYCSHKYERWLVLVVDGIHALAVSQEEIRARAAAILAAQEQVNLRRRLSEQSQFREHFYEQVGILRQQLPKLTASKLAKSLASTFYEQRSRIRNLADLFDDNHGIYYDLAQIHQGAQELIHSTFSTAAESKDSELTATLLLIVWGHHPQWSALVEAGFAHSDMSRTLEQSSPKAARWWRSVVRSRSHGVRLASHAEYNRKRMNYLNDLALRSPVARLQEIIANEEWQLGALPHEYADKSALTALSDAERTALKQRLVRAPAGAWSSLKSQI